MKLLRPNVSPLVVGLAVLLAGCGGGSGGGAAGGASTGSISGRAVNAQGAPLSHAEVSLIPQGRSHLEATATTTTDVEGRFRLEDVPAGTYTLSVRADGVGAGVIDVQVSVTVPAGATVDLTVRITQTGGGLVEPAPGFGSLEGRVLDARTGQPVAGALIQMENERTDEERRTASDSNGFFGFDHLAEGLWKVRARTGDLRSEWVFVAVREGEEVQTELRLFPRSHFNNGQGGPNADD